MELTICRIPNINNAFLIKKKSESNIFFTTRDTILVTKSTLEAILEAIRLLENEELKAEVKK